MQNDVEAKLSMVHRMRQDWKRRGAVGNILVWGGLACIPVVAIGARYHFPELSEVFQAHYNTSETWKNLIPWKNEQLRLDVAIAFDAGLAEFEREVRGAIGWAVDKVAGPTLDAVGRADLVEKFGADPRGTAASLVEATEETAIGRYEVQLIAATAALTALAVGAKKAVRTLEVAQHLWDESCKLLKSQTQRLGRWLRGETSAPAVSGGREFHLQPMRRVLKKLGATSVEADVTVLAVADELKARDAKIEKQNAVIEKLIARIEKLETNQVKMGGAAADPFADVEKDGDTMFVKPENDAKGEPMFRSRRDGAPEASTTQVERRLNLTVPAVAMTAIADPFDDAEMQREAEGPELEL